MRRKEKAYCEQCIHYSRRKSDGLPEEIGCAKAVKVTVQYSATYLHPDIVRKQYCWEKNQDNRCADFEKKVE